MNSVALLLLKYPEPGKVKTRLAAGIGPQAAAAVYRVFVEQLATRFQQAALCYDPAWPEDNYRQWLGERDYLPQQGDDLGQRIAGGLQWAVRHGADKAVLLGTDSPQLDGQVEAAFQALEDDPVVLGPCEDGGYYLIGVRDRVPDLFRDIRWSTSEVLRQTLARARTLGLPVALLDMEYDVDTPADFERLLVDPRLSHQASRQRQAVADKLRTWDDASGRLLI